MATTSEARHAALTSLLDTFDGYGLAVTDPELLTQRMDEIGYAPDAHVLVVPRCPYCGELCRLNADRNLVCDGFAGDVDGLLEAEDTDDNNDGAA